MADWRQAIRDEFRGVGWHELPMPMPKQAGGEFDGLFSGDFAVCAIRVAGSAREVVNIWLELQAALAEFKLERLIDSGKDLYLLFVIDQVDEGSLVDLQRVLDDTRVCRKICLERRGRTIKEMLQDILFFSTPRTTAREEESRQAADVRLEGIPERVQRDLERRSPERILEALIAGEYEVT